MRGPLIERAFRRMSRMALLNGNLWLSLSAERLDAPAKAAEGGYPPYNIELLPEGERGPEILRITLAVAGFRLDELDVSVEDGELMIQGTKQDEAPKDYLHRGIAARHFKRTFALAKGVEVRKAQLHDGLLAIELERPHREKRVLKVGIAPAG
jgi:HSP20 family molecular chaperone IbpA